MIFISPEKSAFITPGGTNNPIKVVEERPKSNTLCPCSKGPLTAVGFRFLPPKWAEESKIVTVQVVGRSTPALPLVAGCRAATFPLQFG